MFVGLLVVLLVLGLCACAVWYPVRIDGVTLVFLVVMAMASEVSRQSWSGRSTSGSVTGVVLAASGVLVGPVGAAAVGLLAKPIWKRRDVFGIANVYNRVQHGLLGLIAGQVYLAAGGDVRLAPSMSVQALLVQVLSPMLVASAATLALNAILLATVIRLDEGVSARVTTLQILQDAGSIYFGYGVVGFLLAVLWRVEGLGPVSVLLVMPPLILAQWSIGGQVEEEQAQQRTLNTLVAAVETRGAQRRGQSERVAEVAAAIGEAIRLGPKRSESLQFAATVHNVGLIFPPQAGESHEGLTDERIHQHPARGVDMLEGIHFLDESRTAIAHHHERWDGTGYPDGLAGAQIPMLARILAVSDLYVALTWGGERATPAEALAVLEQRAGTHLDPSCVAGLRRAVDRGRIEDAAAPDGPELVVDHDAPEVADRLRLDSAR